MDVSQDQQLRTSKGYLFRVCYIARESATTTVLGRYPKAGREEGELYSGKRESFSPSWRLLA